MNFIIPILLISLLVLAMKKRINAYSSFCQGAKKGIKLSFNLIPFIVAIMLLISLMQFSGLTYFICKIFSPILNFLGIPTELIEFVCFRPLTGSGSLAILSNIISTYGPESKITKCACLMMMTTETTFFSSAIYFSKTKNANTFKVLALSLCLCFLAMILSSIYCSILYQ